MTIASGILAYVPSLLLYFVLYGLLLAVGYHWWDVVYSVYRDIKAEEAENTGLPMTFTNTTSVESVTIEKV